MSIEMNTRIINAVQDSDFEEVGDTMNEVSNSGSWSEENVTKTSLNTSRCNLRLKTSDSATTSRRVFPNGCFSTKIPSLLQKLPCHEPSSASSATTRAASAATLSALSVVKKSSGTNDREVMSKNSSPVATHSVDLDEIDIDNISIKDLKGLQYADGDILRAKHLNKLSRRERDRVLQDIHGVADAIEETAHVDHSLEKLKAEINRQLVVRRAKKSVALEKHCHINENQRGNLASDLVEPRLPAPERQSSKLHGKLNQLIRQRNDLDNSVNSGGGSRPCKQLSAKNHPMFGKLGDYNGFGIHNFRSNPCSIKSNIHIQPTIVPSSTFRRSSSLIMSASNSSEAQQDAAILKNEDAIAYEQALAQCRGRRRERNNSLFRPVLNDENGIEIDGLDEGLYIDVEEKEFRLSFLRAERYDVEKAATRILDYFEEKRKLFGVDKLTSKIKIKDLDAVTRDCMESGQVQLLPGRDRYVFQSISHEKRMQDL